MRLVELEFTEAGVATAAVAMVGAALITDTEALPLAEPLASRGVVIIQYGTENLHIVPVFGPNALAVSPRVGHIHVRVDDTSWVWADASGNPIILMGLPPVRTKCSLNWRTRTTTPSTKA